MLEWIFIPSDRNHVRFHVFQDNQSISGLKADYYIQIGSNKKTITLRRQVETEKNPKVLIEKVLEDLTREVTMQIKLTLNDRKDWSLYVLESDSDGYVLIGSCESKISSSCKGDLRLECRYTKTRVNGFGFYSC